jgi:hypothetical protein
LLLVEKRYCHARNVDYLKNPTTHFGEVFINVANNGYLRGLAEELNESTNSIRKELNNLETGYLEKQAIQNKVIYKANKHPLFSILQKIVCQHIGLDAIVEIILQRMGTVEKVIIGDYADGKDSGTIEVILVGDTLDMAYIDQLGSKIEKKSNARSGFC